MPKQKWTVEISIDDCWIEDGLDLTDEMIKDILLDHIGYAYDHEIDVNIIKAPDPKTIRKIQGFANQSELH